MFGSKRKGPPKSLRNRCNKYGVRLTTTRKGERVYKSDNVLRKQCRKKKK